MRSKITIQSTAVGDCLIEPSSTARNLGVIFDREMNLQAHVKHLCQICYMHLRSISSVRGALTMQSTECLIHALITSRLDFCNSLLAGLPCNALQKLQVVQNSAARILTRTSKYEHITPVRYRLHWLPVASRIQYKVLLLVYKALHSVAPDYICGLLRVRQTREGLRSSEEVQLVEPMLRLKSYGHRSFSYAGPNYWNALPSSIRAAPSVKTFKQLIKTYLFDKAYASMGPGLSQDI